MKLRSLHSLPLRRFFPGRLLSPTCKHTLVGHPAGCTATWSWMSRDSDTQNIPHCLFQADLWEVFSLNLTFKTCSISSRSMLRMTWQLCTSMFFYKEAILPEQVYWQEKNVLNRLIVGAQRGPFPVFLKVYPFTYKPCSLDCHAYSLLILSFILSLLFNCFSQTFTLASKYVTVVLNQNRLECVGIKTNASKSAEN